jgi:hypothetical protein
MTVVSTLKAWMQTSSSILGAAVATPAFAAALTGQITWDHAAFPLAGAVVAILLPEAPNAVAQAQPVVTDITAIIKDILPLVGVVAPKVVPNVAQDEAVLTGSAPAVSTDITQVLLARWAEFQRAQDAYAEAQVAATAQRDALSNVIAHPVAPVPPVPPVPLAAQAAMQQNAVMQSTTQTTAMQAGAPSTYTPQGAAA